MPQGASAVSLIALLAVFTPREGIADAPALASAPAAATVALIGIEPSQPAPRAGERLDVYVRLVGANGGPVDGDLAIDCDAGELGPVTRVAAGRYRATLVVPRVMPGTRSLLLAARAGAASAAATLPISAGPPATIAFSGPATLSADGTSSVWLEATIRDAYGNAASDAPRARARLGSVRPARSTGPGVWEIEYVSAHLRQEGVDVVTLVADAASATHHLRLTPRGTWLAFAPWSGAVKLEGSATALAAGAGAAWWWRAGAGAVGAVLDVAWWRLGDSTAAPVPGRVAVLDGERTYVPVTAWIAGAHPLGRHAEGWLAIGGGAAYVATSQALAGQPEITEAGWGPAAVAAAGLGLHAWRGLPFVEARGLWIADAGLVTVTGSTRAVLLLAGYRFDAR